MSPHTSLICPQTLISAPPPNWANNSKRKIIAWEKKFPLKILIWFRKLSSNFEIMQFAPRREENQRGAEYITIWYNIIQYAPHICALTVPGNVVHEFQQGDTRWIRMVQSRIYYAPRTSALHRTQLNSNQKRCEAEKQWSWRFWPWTIMISV